MTTHSTRVSLIERIHNRCDEAAWNEFVALYAPLIYAYGLKRGLQETDATDLVQDVLQAVMEAVDKFTHRAPGSFRGWLFTITLNRIRRKHLLSKRQVAGSGRTSVVHALQDQPAEDQEDWDRQLQIRLFQWAAEQVRHEFHEHSWHAFWMTSVEERSPAEVAGKLSMSLGSVYVAKSRIIKRIRDKIAYADQIEASS